MKYIIPLITLVAIGCVDKKEPEVSVVHRSNIPSVEVKNSSAMDKYYEKHKQDSLSSKGIGSVHSGSLRDASLFPPKGNNFKYFSETSYLKGRAYIHSQVKKITLNTFKNLEEDFPNRVFQVMEIAHEKGGEMWPHHTHQKGTSVDYMLPKEKNGKADYSLDEKGINHYFLATDNKGEYKKSGGVKIDFETTAKMILQLEREARKEGWKIKKVILKVELKDDLFATVSGKALKKTKVYFAKRLSKKVNEIHDDHFHVDFERIKT